MVRVHAGPPTLKLRWAGPLIKAIRWETVKVFAEKIAEENLGGAVGRCVVKHRIYTQHGLPDEARDGFAGGGVVGGISSAG